MSNQLNQETTDVYVARLEHGLALANLRLQRLERELVQLTASLGATAPHTLMIQQRRDRQLLLVGALQGRITLLGGP